MKALSYKGYTGSASVDVEANVIHGKIEDINDLITFESETVEQLKEEFERAVDDYIALCEELGQEPNKPFRGVFNVRTSPEMHKKLSTEAKKKGIKLNTLINNIFDEHLNGAKHTIFISVKKPSQQSNIVNLEDYNWRGQSANRAAN